MPTINNSTRSFAASMNEQPASFLVFLTRRPSLSLGVFTVAGALMLGFGRSLGAAWLALAGGMLLAIILLLWRSTLLLLGEIPLGSTLGAEAWEPEQGALAATKERKMAVLRALKDLEFEHSVGKLTDEDYEQLSTQYRTQAKALLRSLDHDLSPARQQAEAWVAEQRQKQPAPPTTSVPSPSETCRACATENEPDAVFCKRCGQRLTAETEGSDDQEKKGVV